MKQIILTTITLMLFGCIEDKEMYERKIKTYVISDKDNVGFDLCKVYFQTPTTTEFAIIDRDIASNYKIGDTIHVLIKYWEKPKKK